MELFLNFMWLTLSLVLGALLIASRSGRGTEPRRWMHSHATAWMSYLILIALLLPVISMTDDMMAVATRADSEQIARRFEGPAIGQHHVVHHRVLFVDAGKPVPPPLRFIEFLRIRPACKFHFSLPLQCFQGRAPPLFKRQLTNS